MNSLSSSVKITFRHSNFTYFLNQDFSLHKYRGLQKFIVSWISLDFKSRFKMSQCGCLNLIAFFKMRFKNCIVNFL